MKKFKLSRNSKKNIKDVRRGIIQLIERSLEKSENDFGIPKYGGRRSPQEQNNLFHTKDENGNKITYLDGFNKVSYHQSGEAFDIFAYYEGKAHWDYKDKKCLKAYKDIHNTIKEEFTLMKEEGIFDNDEELIWGGDWIRFKDYPHHEIRKK